MSGRLTEKALGSFYGAVIAEGFSLGIEHASLVSYVSLLRVGVEPAQHVEDAVNRPRRLVARIAQVGQGVKGVVEVG